MTITCYDPELDSFADDLAGDFDYLSTLDREAWIANQWTGIAAAMGWSEALDKTLAGLRRSRMGLADLSTAALGAYAEFVDHQREDESGSTAPASATACSTTSPKRAPATSGASTPTPKRSTREPASTSPSGAPGR
jgi:hypothetical protein